MSEPVRERSSPVSNLHNIIICQRFKCITCDRARCVGCPRCQTAAALLADEIAVSVKQQIAVLQEQLKLLEERKQKACLCHWDVYSTFTNGEAAEFICRRCQQVVSDLEREAIDERRELEQQRGILSRGPSNASDFCPTTPEDSDA
jgi:hypothetical protein